MDGKLCATAAIAAILGLAVPTAEAARGSQLSVTVHLVDLAGIPQTDLDSAKAETVRVFRHAGIDLTWAIGSLPALYAKTAVSDGVALFLVNESDPGQAGGAEVVGEAQRIVRRAYVFCNRLITESRQHQTSDPVVLGRVMAHEIGHLLLPAHAHSQFGIMRPQVDFDITSIHSFTRAQADSMRALLDDRLSQYSAGR
jgi:predicted Zn-dependent protease